MTLDAFDFTANNKGLISTKTDLGVTLINIDDEFQLLNSQKFTYAQLVSLDLVNYSDVVATNYIETSKICR